MCAVKIDVTEWPSCERGSPVIERSNGSASMGQQLSRKHVVMSCFAVFVSDRTSSLSTTVRKGAIMKMRLLT